MNERRGHRGMSMQSDYGDEDRFRRSSLGSDDDRFGRNERGLWDRVRGEMREGWEALSGRDDERAMRSDYGREWRGNQDYGRELGRDLGGRGSIGYGGYGGSSGYGSSGYGGYTGSSGYGGYGYERGGYGLRGSEQDYDWRRDRDRDPRGLWDRARDEVREGWQSVKETFQGKGPKGYKRSDDRIREDVCDRLTRHHGVDASELEITVRDGEVTLSGTVLDRRQKRLAEDIVEDIDGVHDVTNQIRVKRQGLEIGGTREMGRDNGVTQQTTSSSTRGGTSNVVSR